MSSDNLIPLIFIYFALNFNTNFFQRLVSYYFIQTSQMDTKLQNKQKQKQKRSKINVFGQNLCGAIFKAHAELDFHLDIMDNTHIKL